MTAQADAARRARIGLVGGIIHRDETGVGRAAPSSSTQTGSWSRPSRSSICPRSPSFWETSHYQPGTAVARPIDAFGMPIGIQVCSDNNRPEGSHLLGALGAEAILVPRASEEKTYQRWKIVFRANALTSTAYVLSVNRPDPEAGVLIGGPSVAVDPAVTPWSRRPIGWPLSPSTTTSSPRPWPIPGTSRPGPASTARRGTRWRLGR